MSEDPAEQPPVERMIGDFISSETEIFVNYVALVEVVNAEGKHGLRLYCSESITPWLAKGMLHAGLDMIYEQENEGVFDDE